MFCNNIQQCVFTLLNAGVFMLGTAQAWSPEPRVRITNGTLQGGRCPSNDMDYFLTIPYAKAPLGDLRFASPQPYNVSWNGTRNATTATPSCPQFGAAFVDSTTSQSENCLFVDIWTPANATDDSKLPVKVWLYGGGDVAGGISWPLYDGCTSDTAAVHVSINYRLGPLGFLVLQDAGLQGNYGVQDQILALQWVQENIAAFGGDKTKVLVFGQSAGALDTHVLASLDIAPSLMNAAIMESGAGQTLPNFTTANAYGEAFAAALPCNLTDINCLRAATPEQMNTTYLTMPSNSSGFVFVGTGFEPVVDGTLIPAQPSVAGVKVPSMIGSTAQEATLFVYAIYGNASASLSESDYDLALIGNFGSLASTVNDTYPLSLYANTSMPAFYAIAALDTLYALRCASYRALASKANSAPVYTYSFNHTPSCTWVPFVAQDAVAELGPAHTAELPFVFGGGKNLPFGTGGCSFTASEVALSNSIQAAWTEMAASGRPGADWPVFSVESTQGVTFDAVPRVGTVDYSMCAFWDDIAADLS